MSPKLSNDITPAGPSLGPSFNDPCISSFNNNFFSASVMYASSVGGLSGPDCHFLGTITCG